MYIFGGGLRIVWTQTIPGTGNNGHGENESVGTCIRPEVITGGTIEDHTTVAYPKDNPKIIWYPTVVMVACGSVPHVVYFRRNS